MPSLSPLSLPTALFVCAAAIAQDPDAPAPPPRAAVTLLLKQPTDVAIGAVVTAASRTFGAEFTTAPRGELPAGRVAAVDGGFDLRASSTGLGAVTIEVRRSDEPVALTAERLRGVGDDAMTAALRAHTAALELAIDGVGEADDQREPVHALLGTLATHLLEAAALGDRVAGIGCADHDAYLPLGVVDLEALRAGAGLDALEPSADSSFVVLLKQPRALDLATMRRAVAGALGVAIDDDGEWDGGFVVARDRMAIVKVGEALTMLTVSHERSDLAAEDYGDLRLRKAIDDHAAVLHVFTSGPYGRGPDLERARRIARLAAELWDDDCLAFSWHSDRRLGVPGPDIGDRLRADDPVAASLELSFVPVLAGYDEAAMVAAVAEARRRFPQAAAWFGQGNELFVKFPFATRQGSQEHIWVRVTALEDGVAKGVLGNAPVDVEGLREGSAVTCKVAELSDWLYMDGKERRGGFTIAVLTAGRGGQDEGRRDR